MGEREREIARDRRHLVRACLTETVSHSIRALPSVSRAKLFILHDVLDMFVFSIIFCILNTLLSQWEFLKCCADSLSACPTPVFVRTHRDNHVRAVVHVRVW